MRLGGFGRKFEEKNCEENHNFYRIQESIQNPERAIHIWKLRCHRLIFCERAKVPKSWSLLFSKKRVPFGRG